MKQLRILSPGTAEWADAPMPTPKPGEVLVKVEGVTTCPQWDLHIMQGEPMFPGMQLDYPYHAGQPGHEMVGTIDALGDPSISLKPGQRVAVWRDSGPARPGAYAQYVALPAQNLLPVSSALTPAEIAPLELAMCVQVTFDQVRQIGDLADATVGITGLGPSGLIAVQIARAMGAKRVIGYDFVDDRCRLAGELGAHETQHPDAPHPDGLFLDYGLDMTGLPAAIRFLTDHSKHAVAMFGVVREDVVFPPKRWYGGFALLGYGNHNLGAAKRALAWVELGKLRLAPLVTHELTFKDYTHAVDLLAKKQSVKVLFDPWAD